MSDTRSARSGWSCHAVVGWASALLCGIAIFAFPYPALAQGDANLPIEPRIIVQSGHAAEISAVAWTSDGRFLLTGSSDAQILIWDLRGRIVNRIAVGNSNQRTVVERIRPLAGNRGAEVDVIWFKDMFDNGVASEVWRNSYAWSFSDPAARETASDPADDIRATQWNDGLNFLDNSRVLKKSLTGRPVWPESPLGWTLVRRGGGLVMVPPEPGAIPVQLTGLLGAENDRGDARLESWARRLEELELAFRSQANSRAKEFKPIDFDPGAPIADFAAQFAPQFAPGGAMLAWIDQGPTNRLYVLDLEQGILRASIDLGRGTSPKPLIWTGPTTLVTDLGGGRTISIDRTATVTSGATTGCALGTSGQLDMACAGPADPLALQPPPAPVLWHVDDQKYVHAQDRITGRQLCSVFLDQTEVAPAAYVRASPDRRWLIGQSASGWTQLFHIPDSLLATPPLCGPGRDCTKPPADFGIFRAQQCPDWATIAVPPGRIGFHPTRPLLWIEGRQGSIVFYNLAAIRRGSEAEGLGSPLFTLYRLPKGQFFAVDAKGRYDANMPPDSQAVRWNVPDAPLQSLAAQTFMRDYYQPGMVRRLMQCAEIGLANCDDRFPPIKPVTSINRVLPQVEILAVKPGAEPFQAIVTVKVAEGVDMAAINGKTRSGLYGLRLFHNDRLAFSWPDPVSVDGARRTGTSGAPPRPRREWVADAMRKDIMVWRELNQVVLDESGPAKTFEFIVTVPPGDAGQKSVFSAYAFNEDRVKSDTAAMAWTMPPAPRRQPRAFIITIGIDAYDSSRLPLQFAAADAALMGERLAAIPGHEVRRITLDGRTGADGKIRRVTRNSITRLFNAMMGTGTAEDAITSAPFREAVIRDLAAEGFDASQLDALRPDDIVFVSFSGHGWADKQGNFHLLPADAEWLEGGDEPNRDTLISATSLTEYLSFWPAREITFIIDACHSAGSVGSADFKPGPMGDAGLGQLAYDKGIRILAATQADDVAIEDATLKQGLLTYALAREGIGTDGGKADSDGDGRIMLEEWLSYATWRMPSLAAEVRQGRTSGDANGLRGWIRTRAAAPPPVQQPALFDFNAKPSGMMLQKTAKP